MKILTILIATISLTASVIEIIKFIKGQERRNFITLIVIVTLSILVSWISINQLENSHIKEVDDLKKIHETELLKFRNDYIIQDAQVTLNSLNYLENSEISEAIGDLSRLAGFYKRHKDLYLEEYESLKNSINTFEKLRDKKIQDGDYFTGDEETEINATVTSGKKHLKSIATQKLK